MLIVSEFIMDKPQKNSSVGLLKSSRKTVISIIVFLISACSSVEDHISETEQDYCSAIDNTIPAALSEYLSPFEDKMKNSTGVYVLEQGTEAMFSRAWLSDHAKMHNGHSLGGPVKHKLWP